jgi:GT2 family glycosyltransferase
MKKQPASRAAPQLRAEVALLAEGVVRVTLAGPGAKAHGEVAVTLDGVLQDTLALADISRGARGAEWQLPRGFLFGELDVLGLTDGQSLLPVTFLLGAAYELDVRDVALRSLAVEGAFSAAAWLAPVIGVELMDGAARAGGGLARRGDDGVWRFRAQLDALLPPGRTASLTLRVGGLAADAPPVLVSAGALGFVGCLDLANPLRVEGWAMNLADPGKRVSVEVLVGTEVVGTLMAKEKRDDLKRGGAGDGRYGFDMNLPDPQDPRARRRIGVRIAGTLTHVSGSPVVIDPHPDLMGRFDTLHGMSAHGWAVDMAHPQRKVIVEAVGPDGAVLGQAPANVYRGDLLGAGLADGLCAFKIDLSAHFERLIGQDIVVRFAGTKLHLPGSPIRILPNGNMQRFLKRRDVLRAKPGVLPRLKRALTHRAGDLGVSIIMPVFNTPRTWLSEALESVRHQFCDAWELICIDDGSTAPHVRSLLESYAKNDARVRVLSSTQNVGVTRAVNFGLRAARYPYVTFLDHDDYLEPDAVWQLIRAAQMTDGDLIYGDEALTDENLVGILDVRLRPAFSHDYYLSHPYFVHPVCVRTELARRIGGWDESLAISADVDFVLRVIEAAERVTHVPAVLYRWRTHAASAGHAKQQEVMAATIGALQRHLDRLGGGGRVSEGPWFNQFRVDWPASDGLILIVIPTRNGCDLLRTAVESIERTAGDARYRLVVIDHESDDAETVAYLGKIGRRHVVMPYKGVFNFSRMNNQAVKLHGHDAAFVLFLNNDIEATQEGWLDRMRSLANRPDVGAVGALLMYKDRRVQHAGVVLGFNNSADHALRLQEVFLDEGGRRNLGYNCSLVSVRDFSAVTAACVMMRRDVFDQVKGFDESFGIGFNDTDLCLRIGAAGYKILYDGYTILYHYESATRSQTKQVFHPADTKRMVKRWGKALAAGDPFYNPNLSLRTQDHVPREDPDCRITYAPRVREGKAGGAGRPPRPPSSV